MSAADTSAADDEGECQHTGHALCVEVNYVCARTEEQRLEEERATGITWSLLVMLALGIHVDLAKHRGRDLDVHAGRLR